MVEGLEKFKERFRKYNNQFVLIGGAACDQAMTAAGLDFRATKDLDVVLCIEALDGGFIKEFWKFIRDGNYKTRMKETGKKCYYRFQHPGTEGFPAMIELFSRKPDAMDISKGGHLTPIPAGNNVSSLSAILLSDDYYQLVLNGKKEIDGLPVVGPEHLIPLKARAWLDLEKRRVNGEAVSSSDIRKHRNDVFRLFGLIRPEKNIKISGIVKADMREFIKKIQSEIIDFKSLGLKSTPLPSIILVLQKVYGL
jgi:hypothetical protein